MSDSTPHLCLQRAALHAGNLASQGFLLPAWLEGVSARTVKPSRPPPSPPAPPPPPPPPLPEPPLEFDWTQVGCCSTSVAGMEFKDVICNVSASEILKTIHPMSKISYSCALTWSQMFATMLKSREIHHLIQGIGVFCLVTSLPPSTLSNQDRELSREQAPRVIKTGWRGLLSAKWTGG